MVDVQAPSPSEKSWSPKQLDPRTDPDLPQAANGVTPFTPWTVVQVAPPSSDRLSGGSSPADLAHGGCVPAKSRCGSSTAAMTPFAGGSGPATCQLSPPSSDA